MQSAIIVLLVCLGLVACARQSEEVLEPPATSPLPARMEIWAAIQPQAERYRMDPAFIYALVAAESNFDPRARNGEARGLMQIKPAAWQTVSSAAYEPTVWDWQANLAAGIDYLAYSRSYLHKKNVFSYPHLLAAFHYGLSHLEDRRFDLARVRVPDNAIYRELWRGNLNPIDPPVPTAADAK